jgi:hypothetical protein
MAQQYPNRTDLSNPAKKLAVTTAPGQTYGKAGEQRRAQQAVPMGTPQQPQAPQQQQQQQPLPVTPLNAPTERPDEPITAGNPLGAGPGMDMLPQPMPMATAPGSRQDLINQVRYIYSKTPNTALLQLILELENVSI